MSVSLYLGIRLPTCPQGCQIGYVYGQVCLIPSQIFGQIGSDVANMLELLSYYFEYGIFWLEPVFCEKDQF